ncbi:ArdC family protein [Actinoplanes sp. CA-030573]|uniref:ArdC family protein n=1 Tax=Actinoplanes sp. CA-030573 TaxID=3239898 RepID=UPI003D90A022
MAPPTGQHDTLIAAIKADFNQRLAALAADPQQWAALLGQVAVFGTRYSFANQLLLTMQADERGITAQYFLPYGNAGRRTGWFRHGRHVRAGERAFKVWAPITRRPTAEQADAAEKTGRGVDRDPAGPGGGSSGSGWPTPSN